MSNRKLINLLFGQKIPGFTLQELAYIDYEVHLIAEKKSKLSANARKRMKRVWRNNLDRIGRHESYYNEIFPHG